MMTDPEPEVQASRDLCRENIQIALRCYEWRASSAKPLTDEQTQRIAELVGSGKAEGLPPIAQHTTSLVQLRRLLAGGLYYYIGEFGTVWAGNTFAQARRVEL